MPKFNLSKRGKFVITAAFLSVALLAVPFVDFTFRFATIGLLSFAAYFLSAWSLKEGLSGIEWLTVLTLPSYFAAGVSLFFFLIPAGWMIRLAVTLLFGLGFYVLLLTENIFSVAAIRTIQLLRSAQAVGFLLTVVTAFLIYDAILSFRFSPWVNGLLVGLFSLPLVLQALWYVQLEERITPKILIYSLSLSLTLAEAGFVFSFWPLAVASESLALTTVFYMILGLAQHQLEERLFKRTVYEYLGVGLVVLLITIFTTRWGGI